MYKFLPKTIFYEEILYNKLTSINTTGASNLIYLNCPKNTGLTSLDLSTNTKLVTLGVGDCNLGSLDLSNNVDLTTLSCYLNTNLTSIDFTTNTKLKYAYIPYNGLTSLDFTTNTALLGVSCHANNLLSLNASTCTNLVSLYCYNNGSLSTICVPNAVSAEASGSFVKDALANWSDVCGAGAPEARLDQSLSATTVIKAYNTQGREVAIDTKGEMIILLYNDGTTQKVFQQ